MMQSPERGQGIDHAVPIVGCSWGRNREALRETLMRPRRVEGEQTVLAQDLIKMALAENDHVVETLASRRAEEALHGGIHEQGLHSRSRDADAGTLGCTIEQPGARVVPIAQQHLWSLAERRRLAELLCGPLCGGSAVHADVHDPAAVHIHDEESEERAEPHIVHLQEVSQVSQDKRNR